MSKYTFRDQPTENIIQDTSVVKEATYEINASIKQDNFALKKFELSGAPNDSTLSTTSSIDQQQLPDGNTSNENAYIDNKQTISNKERLILRSAPKECVQQPEVNSNILIPIQSQATLYSVPKISFKPQPCEPKIIQETQEALKIESKLPSSQSHDYTPFRRYRESSKPREASQSKDIQPLKNKQLVINIAEQMGFRDIFNKVLSIEETRKPSHLNPPESFQLKFYCEQSISDNFKYQDSKAGDRPEIAEMTIRGDISNLETSLQQEVNSLLNKFANSEQNILVKRLVEIIDNQKLLSMKWDIIEMIVFEIYEKSCIEDKFVEFYAKVFNLFYISISNNKQIQTSVLEYTQYTTFKAFISNLLIKCRVQQEIVTYKLLDAKFSKNTNSYIIDLHMKLALKFLAYLYIQNDQIISAKTLVKLCNMIFTQLSHQKQEKSEKTPQNLQQSRQNYEKRWNEAKSIAVKQDYIQYWLLQFRKDELSNCNYIDMILEAVKIAIRYLLQYKQQTQELDYMNEFELLFGLIRFIYDHNLFSAVQSFHIRDKNILDLNININCEDIKRNNTSQSSQTQINITNITLQHIQSWKNDDLSFEGILLFFTGSNIIQDANQILQQRSVSNKLSENLLNILKKYKDINLTPQKIQQFLFQSQKQLRKVDNQQFFTSIVDWAFDTLYSWDKDNYQFLIKFVSDLLIQKQLSFTSFLSILKDQSNYNILLQVLKQVIQYSYQSTLMEYNENEQLTEEQQNYILNLIEQEQFNLINDYVPYQQCLKDDNFSYFNLSKENLSTILLNKFELDLINLLHTIFFQKIPSSAEAFKDIVKSMLQLVPGNLTSSQKVTDLFIQLKCPFAQQVIDAFSFKSYYNQPKFIEICFEKSFIQFLQNKDDYFIDVISYLQSIDLILPTKFYVNKIINCCQSESKGKATSAIQLCIQKELFTKDEFKFIFERVQVFIKYDLSWLEQWLTQ
ncbi:hypothetical protein SS50377_22123 [Spironucleus salmonicida]|uniref:Uncharacterized protein n=1 Tax=Spironucleus salmonicida TaxID=348837 RepID=V6LM02_9EUKA|nr:hypothetical protein SS50377_22123 [Spironucleus salmonicida]|eukprot:EST45717.1 hypothetical protein SS50377_14288 [Spironucleus salmonicida]